MARGKKKAVVDPDEPKKKTMYTHKLSQEQLDKLQHILEMKMWEPYEVEYAQFGFKGNKVNVVGYKSGKLVVQGKDTEDFIINTLEPEVLGEARFGYDEVYHPEWFESHAGMDESGKGDLFGPVVTACVIADKVHIDQWVKAGIRDSKTITDGRILKLDKIIRETKGVSVETCFCGMTKYNELMGKPRANLNLLLAWQHAKSLTAALAKKRVPWGMLDQFSKQNLVGRYFKDPKFDLRMQTKAEADPVVAAASVVARAEYVRYMDGLSKKFGDTLAKGASAKVKAQATEILHKFGPERLGEFAKLHFKTSYQVVEAAGMLDRLPLKKPKETVFKR
ncbi:ribonuclease HIII [Pelagicoccus sp. SDUM812005]|uniref:ribonuclease HIII n=1 Tax=Pelagicoccus sp. SDUM812005 TaxID=3041257 RepID=UPI00280C41F2|nr:ribonuclease HIII [Pelagicoccus sp. SDUM812005]MDQ8179056.1 ribonuclease HIII [Pelagicoccus sp. SDUM812005]